MLGENLADWMGDHGWAIWFSLALLLAIAEILSLDLVLIMLAAGALAGGVTALIAPDLWWVQVLVAVVVSIMSLVMLRPTVMKRVRNMPGYRSAFASMVGQSGRVVQQVDAVQGEIKVNGQSWSARAFDESMVIEPGVEIEVFELDGTVAVVYPRHSELEGR
jgi:membrane protein implicated in regulation of membrane protease activity